MRLQAKQLEGNVYISDYGFGCRYDKYVGETESPNLYGDIHTYITKHTPTKGENICFRCFLAQLRCEPL